MFVHFAKVEAFPESIVELLRRLKKKKELVISSQQFNLSRSISNDLVFSNNTKQLKPWLLNIPKLMK